MSPSVVVGLVKEKKRRMCREDVSFQGQTNFRPSLKNSLVWNDQLQSFSVSFCISTIPTKEKALATVEKMKTIYVLCGTASTCLLLDSDLLSMAQGRDGDCPVIQYVYLLKRRASPKPCNWLEPAPGN